MDLGIPLKGVLKIAHLRGVAEILAMQDAYMDVGVRQSLEHIVEQLPVHFQVYFFSVINMASP